LGIIVGVTIGTLIVILAILGCCIICWGKRRRRAKLQRLAERNAQQVSEFSSHQLLAEPKWSQSGQMSAGGWSQDESPATAGGWGSESFNAFSPYSSKYGSPMSARDTLNPKQTWEWPGMRASVVPAKPTLASSQLEKRNFSPYSSPSSAHDPQGPKLDWDQAEAIKLERMRSARMREQEREREEAKGKGVAGREEGEHPEQKHEQFLAEVARRGFTTAPVIKVPDQVGKMRG
jgi:hypothetical protein